MSRNLLILALLVFGTGCSVTRPLMSTIVVTPPRLSFRQLPLGNSWHWTAVAVAYPSGALIPAPCTPSPVCPAEMAVFFEEEDLPAPWSPNGPVPSATTDVPVPQVNGPVADPPAIVYLKDATSPQSVDLSVTNVTPVPSATTVVVIPQVNAPAPAPPAIIHLEDATSPQSADLLIPNVAPVPAGVTPIIQAPVAIMYPPGSLIPVPCAPSPVRHTEMAAFFEEEERHTPWSSSEQVPAVKAVVSTPPAIAHLEDATSPQSAELSAPNVSPVCTGITPIGQIASMSTLPPSPVRAESPSVLLQPDFSELLTEIRNQRKLIEALQRELTRERSADDAALDELEAAVENLLVQTKTAQSDLPTTMRK